MNKTWLIIGVAGLTAALLDAMGAIIFLGARPAMLFKFIAMGVFGKSAMQGGKEMIVWGLIFHIIIATAWAFLFVLLWKRFPFIRRNIPATVILYGLLIWVVMNVVILPLSKVPGGPITFSSFWRGALILIVAVSLPIALITRRTLGIKAQT